MPALRRNASARVEAPQILFDEEDGRDEEGDRKYKLREWYYVCVSSCLIEKRSKFQMIRAGQWRATSRPLDEGTVGFHLNVLYTPFVEWRDVIEGATQSRAPEDIHKYAPGRDVGDSRR